LRLWFRRSEPSGQECQCRKSSHTDWYKKMGQLNMIIFDDPALKIARAGELLKRKSKEISDSPLGVGFETLDREMFIPEKCYNFVAAAGAKWARCQTGWNRCEPVKGRYDFAWLDAVVDNLLRRGVQPWFNLGYGNILYMPGAPHETAVGCAPTGYGEECLIGWKNFVAAISKHFSGRVNHWEIWNEPNIDLFWQPYNATGTHFTELVAITAPIIKAAVPQAIISGCCSEIAMAFVQEALEAGIGNYIDRLSIHPYSPLPEKNYFSGVAALRRLFQLYAPHVKLEQGECGYPSQTYHHQDRWLAPYYASEETQAKYVVRRIVLDFMARMDRISYFHIIDLVGRTYRLADGKARPPVRLGLLHGDDYTPKLSYEAFTSMANIFDSQCKTDDLYAVLEVDWSLRQTGALPFLAPIVGTFVRKHYPLYAYYFPEDLQRGWVGMTNVTLQTLTRQPGTKSIEKPILIDTLTGQIYTLTDYENTPAGYLHIKGLPLTDYPLLITDAAAVDMDINRKNV